MLSLPAVATDALVHADFVDAGAAIATRVALTVVNVWGAHVTQLPVSLLPRVSP